MAGVSFHSVLAHLRRLQSITNAAQCSDRELLRTFVANNDQDAFAAVMMRHAPLVWGVCRRILRQQQDAEDAFQATFLILARRAGSIRWQSSVGGWLHTVAQRLAVRARQQAEQRRVLERETSRTPSTDPSLRDLAEVVDEELARLPAKYRGPLLLHYLEGATAEDAARQLGLSRATFYHRLAHGRELLRTRLSRQGVSLSASLLTAALTAEADSAPQAFIPATLRAVTGTVPQRVAALAAEAVGTTAIMKLTIGLTLGLLMGVVAVGLTFWNPPAPVTPIPQAEWPADPPQAEDKAAVRVDRYGDPLPPGAIARLGSLRFRYEGPAQEGLVYSPDGKILVGVCRTGIIFWDAQNGRELRRLKVKISAITSRPFDFSPDGATLAALDIASKIHFWDVATGRLLRTVAAPKAAHYQGDILRYSPDGKQLAVCWRESSVHLLDAATGRELRQFQISRSQVTDFAFAPDGKTLALTSFHPSVRLCDVATGKIVRSIDATPKDKGTYSVAFTRDGKTLAVGSWDLIVVAEAATGNEIARFEAKCESVSGLSFTRDGRTLLSSSQDGKLRFWGLEKKKLRTASDSRHRLGRCLALSPDGKTVAMGTGGSFVRLWDVASGKEQFTQYSGPDSRIVSVVFSPEGRTLFASEQDRQVHLWDTASWSEKGSFAGGSQLTLTADGRQMAWADAKHTIHIRDAGADHDRRQWPIAGKDHLLGPIFAGSADRLVTVDWKRGARTAMNPAQWGTARLVVWDAATGTARHEIALPPVIPECLEVSPHRAKAYLGGQMPDAALLVADLERGELASPLRGHKHSITSLALSAEGRLLASVGLEQSLRLWETASAKEIRVWPKQQAMMAALAFSPDGRILASADGSPRKFVFDVPAPRIHLWDVVTGKEITEREGHQAHVWALAFSPDGKRLASVQDDSTILIWDVSSAVAAVRARPIKLDRPALTAAWNDLASVEAPKALEAVWKLETAPQDSVSFLQERLRPIQAIEAERMRQWIAALDSDNFATREKAGENLSAADRQAEPALLRTLKENPTLELRRRVQAVLERLHGPVTRPELLQALRAVAVLEDIGNAEARRLLEQLATGAAEARLTREAKASLERLKVRSAGK